MLAQSGQQLQQSRPEHHQRGEYRAGLDGDVEQLGARAEPMFGDQQMTGAGDGQEFGQPFDDAEQGGVQQIDHLEGPI